MAMIADHPRTLGISKRRVIDARLPSSAVGRRSLRPPTAHHSNLLTFAACSAIIDVRTNTCSANPTATQTPFSHEDRMMHHVTGDDPDLQRLIRARHACEQATDEQESEAAQHNLRVAAEAARDAEVSWSRIGDALGISRGNAYKRYRRKPTRRGGASRR